jgi:hypothetical protein
MAKKKDATEPNVETNVVQDVEANAFDSPDPRDARIKELEERVDSLGKALEDKLVAPSDCVFLGGEKYRIVHRNTVKELGDDMRKNFVDENLTAVVIDKFGG